MNINLAKLNHVLIPSTKEGRDRFRRGLLGRATRPFWGLYGALSEEGRVLAVASIVIGAFGLDVQTTDVYVLWAALVGLLGGALLLRRFFPLDGVELEVDAPRRVTVGEPITFSIVLHNRGSRDRHAVRVRGPFLPWDGRFLGASPAVSLLAAGKIARVELAARFVERGEHHLDPFHAAALVPLGLASGEAAASSGCRFLVIPKIAPVARLRLPMGRRYQPGGVALASKSGESMELHGVRPYRAGDPVRQLHAKSWARVGWPVVREYQEEYFSRVGVIVDAATREPRRLEAILSLAAGVVAHLGRGEALIDLLVVGERIHDLTIGRHLGFLEQALDLLACVRIEAAIEPDRLIAQLARHLAQLSCVVVVAPAWDGGVLATRIRGRGVACVTLVVGDAPRADGVWSIDVAALERGEPLMVG